MRVIPRPPWSGALRKPKQTRYYLILVTQQQYTNRTDQAHHPTHSMNRGADRHSPPVIPINHPPAPQHTSPATPLHQSMHIVGHDPSHQIDRLSKREWDVLHLIAQGIPNQGIAQALTITLNTVKMHIQHIYHKLSVRNRTQAIAKAWSITNNGQPLSLTKVRHKA